MGQVLERIRTFYKRSKAIFVYSLVIFAAITLFGRDVLDALGLGQIPDRLLPLAVTAAFSVLLETLFSIQRTVEERADTFPVLFNTLAESIPAMTKAFQERKERTELKAILATARTTLAIIFPVLIREGGRELDIDILLINPESPWNEYLPEHSRSMSEASLQRLQYEIAEEIRSDDPNRAISIRGATFSYSPWLNAFLINDRHLFLSFYGWASTKKERRLTEIASRPYLYYQLVTEKSEGTLFFSVFNDWFANAPKMSKFHVSSSGKSEQEST